MFLSSDFKIDYIVGEKIKGIYLVCGGGLTCHNFWNLDIRHVVFTQYFYILGKFFVVKFTHIAAYKNTLDLITVFPLGVDHQALNVSR